MWNLKCSNRLIDMRAKKQAHSRHMRALHNVKSQINNQQPAKFSFLDIKAKAQQIANQKNRDVQFKNSLLVHRMMNMSSDIDRNKSVFTKQSLNSEIIRKAYKNIDNENQKIVKRLQRATSAYSRRALSKSVSQYQRAKSNLVSSKIGQYYDFQTNNDRNSYFDFPDKSKTLSRRPFSAKK